MTSKVVTGLLAYVKARQKRREMRGEDTLEGSSEKALWERFAISTMENAFTRSDTW